LRAEDLTATGTCEPLRQNGSDDDSGSVFLPCGVIANSFFNGMYMHTIIYGTYIARDTDHSVGYQFICLHH